jgi:hypothetical protein
MRLRSPSQEVARDCLTCLSSVSRASESGRFGSCRASPSMPSAQRALRTEGQARKAAAFRSGAILVDRARTFWTMTLWDDEAAMRRYILAGVHRQAMPKLVRGCDEASDVHWTQPAAAPPSQARRISGGARTDARPRFDTPVRSTQRWTTVCRARRAAVRSHSGLLMAGREASLEAGATGFFALGGVSAHIRAGDPGASHQRPPSPPRRPEPAAQRPQGPAPFVFFGAAGWIDRRAGPVDPSDGSVLEYHR